MFDRALNIPLLQLSYLFKEIGKDMININTHKEKQHVKLIKSALTTLGLNTGCALNTKEAK